MNRIHFDAGYLSELEFVAPARHKLVYLFVTTFRGCKKDDIAPALGMSRWEVSGALESLRAKDLIEIDGRGRCRLPWRREALPLMRVLEIEESKNQPAWIYGGD